jgi:hypothetical protein
MGWAKSEYQSGPSCIVKITRRIAAEFSESGETYPEAILLGPTCTDGGCLMT